MNMHALVVDDSGIMRKLVMKALAESQLAQFTFEEARDGAEALEVFQSKQFDILFCDWNMPNMDGLSMIMQVRHILKSTVPIVMITTESTIGKLEEALTQGKVNGYIVKPFTTAGVVSKIKHIFEELEARKNKPGVFARLAAKLR